MESKPQLLPKWLQKRYLVLWKIFGEKKFKFNEAQEELDEDSRVVALVLSELNKYGWIKSIEPDKKDERKKIYQLVSFEKGIEFVTREAMRSEVQT